MSMHMECRAQSIGDLLGGGSVYRMPPFQRAFSWGPEEAVQLFDDVRTAYEDSCHNPDSSRQYFLGQLIVSKARVTAPLDVVDGQQRLVTLTIIVALLRDFLPDGAVRSDLQNYLRRPHNAAQHLLEQPRVKIRQADQEDYERWIVEPDGTSRANRSPQTPATEKISLAITRIQEELEVLPANYVDGLIKFLLNNCYVVLTIADNPDDAYKLFRSINARGQPLTELDIIRGEFLTPFAQDRVEANRLAEAWTRIQDELGDDELEKYIVSVIRLVEPYNGQASLKDTLRTLLLHQNKGPLFLNTLRRLIDTYTPLERHELDFGEHSHRINRVVSCIDALPFDDWRPALLLWLARKPNALSTLQFMEAIDALGLGLLILGATKNTIAKRFSGVLRDVVEETALTSPASALWFTSVERQRIRKKLREPIPARSRFATPLLLRLNADMLDPTIPTYFPETATLEHILPQKPATNSQWRAKFPDDERRQHLSQLMGNFAILTGRTNSRARNYDFQRKKQVIFGPTDANTFPLTAQLTNYEDWTEENILARQEQLTEHAKQILNV